MNAGQQKTMQLLGRYFGIPRKVITPLVEASLREYEQVAFSLGDVEQETNRGMGSIAGKVILVSKEELPGAATLISWERLRKTPLFAHFMEQYASWGEDLLFVAVSGYSPYLYVIRPVEGYEGYGGVVVKNTGEPELDIRWVVTEPLINYLKAECPLGED